MLFCFMLATASARAAATPVPVWVKSAAPEVIRSMPPVLIQHILEGPNPWLAFWGPLIVALVALSVACITLWKVFDQIKIATKQIGLAEDELAAVKADFELTQKMYEQSNKKPNLELQITNQGEEMTNFQGSPYRKVTLEFVLANHGAKVAHNVLLNYFVPSDALFRHPNILGGGEHLEQIDGVAHVLLSKGDGLLRVPVMGVTHWEWVAWLVPELASLTILFRIYDDEYAYPDDWGRATFLFEPWAGDQEAHRLSEP